MGSCPLHDISQARRAHADKTEHGRDRTSFSETMSHNRTTDLRDRITAKHDAAATAAEGRRLALALAPFGVSRARH